MLIAYGFFEFASAFSPLHHKLPIGIARAGVDVGDVRVGGEVEDVKGATHVVHGHSR